MPIKPDKSLGKFVGSPDELEVVGSEDEVVVEREKEPDSDSDRGNSAVAKPGKSEEK